MNTTNAPAVSRVLRTYGLGSALDGGRIRVTTFQGVPAVISGDRSTTSGDIQAAENILQHVGYITAWTRFDGRPVLVVRGKREAPVMNRNQSRRPVR